MKELSLVTLPDVKKLRARFRLVDISKQVILRHTPGDLRRLAPYD